MTTCKATLRVLFAHRLTIVIYLVFIGIMMLSIGWSQLQGVHEVSDTYTPQRAKVAVIDRDAGRGSVADSMRAYLAADNELVDVADDAETLQRAVASNWVDLIVIVPDGYADALLASATSGGEAPSAETVTSYTSGAGSMASMDASGFLSLTRMELIGRNAAVDDAQWQALARTYANAANGANGASAHAGASGSSSVQVTPDASALSALPQGTPKDLTQDSLAAAAQRARDLASDADANRAIGVDHVDAPTEDTAARTAVTGFGSTMKTVLYPLFLALTVCTALVMAVFNAGETRRRLFASPQSPAKTGLLRMATLCGFACVVVAAYFAIALVLLPLAGLDVAALAPSGVAMTVASAAVYALMTVACGFMLGEWGLSDTMAQGFANVFGLLILFTSGVAFPPDMMPAPMIALGHMLPGWWYCVAVDDALGIGTATAGGVDVGGWAAATGLVALFAVAFVCVGLAVGRLRRTAPVRASVTRMAEA